MSVRGLKSQRLCCAGGRVATDCAARVQALYCDLHTWQRVADACNGGKLTHGPGYYYQIATGRIRMPSEAVRLGIEQAPAFHQALLKCDFSTNTHGGLTIRRPLWLAMREWKIAHSMTWDQWHEKAHELMRREYGEP